MGSNAVVNGCDLRAGLHAAAAQCIGPNTDITTIPRVTPDGAEFLQDALRSNSSLVQWYRCLLAGPRPMESQARTDSRELPPPIEFARGQEESDGNF